MARLTCPNCGVRHVAMSTRDRLHTVDFDEGTLMPRAGDISVCGCKKVLKFTEDLELVPATEGDLMPLSPEQRKRVLEMMRE